MADIFLSYAVEDRARLKSLVEALTRQGWSVAWERTIPPGQTWQEVLAEELQAARALAVIWSEHAVRRKWVIDEVQEGIRRRLPLFQVLIDKVLPPLEFRSRQSINLADWDEDLESFAFQNLVRNIRQTLGQPAPRPSPAQMPPTAGPEQAVAGSRPGEAQGFVNTLGMAFAFIPAGTFWRGAGPAEKGDDDEQPRHQVTLSQSFYLQTTPVTQGQWKKLMGDNPAFFPDCGEDCPVENVSWVDAREFIQKLNRREETELYRLPTEAQWEYACRAGGQGSFCFGDDEAGLRQYAWYAHNSQGSTHPVGTLRPNPWGLYDLHGNVFEWCQDRYGKYAAEALVDPEGAAVGEHRVLRGGSWESEAFELRSAYRLHFLPGYRYGQVGFRVARGVESSSAKS